MSGWVDTAKPMRQLFEDVADVGPVLLGDRDLRDPEALDLHFGTETPEGMLTRGVRIVRDTISEDWWTSLRTQALETYRARFLRVVSEDGASEVIFQEAVDRVLAAIRSVTTIGTGVFVTAGRTESVGFVRFEGGGRNVLCHYAEITVQVLERYTIVPAGFPAVPLVGTANARDLYSDVAAQLVAYLEPVTGGAKVHAYRPYMEPNPAARQELFEVPVSGDSHIRTWRVYRDGNAEERSLGPRAVATPSWRMNYSLGWKDTLPDATTDEIGTYGAFQRDVDLAREIFRGVSVLGRPTNPTMACSSPLQIRELGARRLMDTLVHFADCELPVEEVVHA